MTVDTPTHPAGVDVALDAHYYSGGLRVRRLGGDAAWPPSPAERFAGFRDEVPLDGDDQVVELARLDMGGHRFWWIAIYRRSTDDQLGNRGNHAGVGVWIRDGEVREPLLLLHGLAQLTTKLVEGGPDHADHVARSFLAAEHLPQYVRPSTPMPEQLAGWHRAGGPMPTTALFVTDATADTAWTLVAEQIDRMSLMPGPSPDHSRAIVLVRAPGSRASGAGLAQLAGGLAGELTASLPAAVAGMVGEATALRQQVDALGAESATLRGELQMLRVGEAAAQARIGELEEQVAQSDILRRLASIDDLLKAIDGGVRAIDGAQRRSDQSLMALRRDTGQRAAATPDTSRVVGLSDATWPDPDAPARQPARGSGRSVRAGPDDSVFGMPAALLWPVVGVILFLVAVVLFVLWFQSRP